MIMRSNRRTLYFLKDFRKRFRNLEELFFNKSPRKKLTHTIGLDLDTNNKYSMYRSIYYRSPKRKKPFDLSFETPRPLRTIAEENLNVNSIKNEPLGNNRFEKFPALKKPLRVELPSYFNTPQRTNFTIITTEFGAKRSSLPAIKPTIDSEEQLRVRKRLKDYQLLAQACKRGKKPKDEGRAYYSMGVLLDNMGVFAKSIECYHKFLEICKILNDKHGEALAYNCLGVAYQLLALNGNNDLYKEAITYHMKHKEISDVHGKFIAYINLGLVYDKMRT